MVDSFNQTKSKKRSNQNKMFIEPGPLYKPVSLNFKAEHAKQNRKYWNPARK